MSGNEAPVISFGDRRYRVRRPWGVMPDKPKLGGLSKGAVDVDGNLYVSQRIDPPIVVFAPDGRYLRSFGSGLVGDSHGVRAAGDRVFVVDRDGHQVVAFDRQGRHLFTLGERDRPRYQEPFNHPTDVAVAASGDIYVADGYGNTRVHRFSADGRHLGSWGRPGSGPGEFFTPHGIDITRDGRVLVGDRENNRIQVFDPEGRYLSEWGNFYKPMDIFVSADDMVYVSDQIPRATALRSDGTVVGSCKPALTIGHGVCGDAQGNIYFIETRMVMISRMEPIP